jgi:hypothetical protein
MTLRFDAIPPAYPDAAREGDTGPAPTGTLRELPRRPSRRSVLRGVTVAAIGLGAAALTLSWPAQSRRALAETGRSGLLGYDDAHCRDAYPYGYGERYDSGGAYTSRNGYAAACTGGAYISHSYCLFGWHRYPRSDRCGPAGKKRNAWRWTTPDGKVFRCSDGTWIMSGRAYFTVCRARVA